MEPKHNIVGKKKIQTPRAELVLWVPGGSVSLLRVASAGRSPSCPSCRGGSLIKCAFSGGYSQLAHSGVLKYVLSGGFLTDGFLKYVLSEGFLSDGFLKYALRGGFEGQNHPRQHQQR